MTGRWSIDGLFYRPKKTGDHIQFQEAILMQNRTSVPLDEDLRLDLSAELDPITFQIKQIDNGKTEERLKSLRKVAEAITKLTDYQQEAYIDQVAEFGLMGKRNFKSMLKSVRQQQAKERQEAEIKEVERSGSESDRLKLMVNHIRRNEGNGFKQFEIKRKVSDLICSDMEKIGQFHCTPDKQCYWFNEGENRLYTLTGTDVDLAVAINQRYGLNQTEKEYHYLVAELIAEASSRPPEAVIRRFCHFDRHKGLYLYNNKGEIYFLDGQTVELVPNGKDGVMFLSNTEYQYFSYQPNTKPGQIDRFLIDQINFDKESSRLDISEQQLLFRVWLHSLFFGSIQPTKPLIAFIGEARSGKTFTLRLVGKVLFGGRFEVSGVDAKREDDCRINIINSAFVALDNVDKPLSWLEDLLASVCTGVGFARRKLFTDTTQITDKADCFLAVTSRTPHFMREDVVDRMIPFKVKRWDKASPDARTLSALMASRNVIMSEFMDNLNRMVSYYLRNPELDYETSFRIADFAEVGLVYMRSVTADIEKPEGLGNYWDRLLGKLINLQSDELLLDHPIYHCLQTWMQDENNHGRTVIAADLFEEFEKRKSDGFRHKTTRSFGRELSSITSNLQNFYQIEVTKKGNRKAYTFRPLRS